MKKRITNTQYLRKGYVTNVGVVKVIHDNKNFTTTEGWYYNLDETETFIISKK